MTEKNMVSLTGRNNAKLNIITSIILQVITFVSGLVIPRLILVQYGSQVNGLVSSLNQFLSLISLFEGGFGSVVLASLYFPLSKNSKKDVASVMCGAKKYFKKLGMLFIAYNIVILLVFPYITKTDFNKVYIMFLGLVLGANLVIQYYMSICNRLLLEADQNGFIVYVVQSVAIIVTTLLTYLFIGFMPDVIYVKLLRAVVFLLQPILLSYVVNHYYDLGNSKNDKKEAEIKDKRSGFIQNIAFFIHSNTDVVILTIFSNLTNVSIYSIYSMIVIGLRTMIITIKNGFIPLIGNSIARKDQQELSAQFDYYEFVIIFFSTIIFGCTLILIVPFVELYTIGVNDTNYSQLPFAIILTIAEYIYCIREPHISVDLAAGKFRETNLGPILEMITNLTVSICLTIKLGLLGVAIGTMCAVSVRLVFHLIYNSRNVVFNNTLTTIKRFLISILSICIPVIAFFAIGVYPNTFVQWIMCAVLCFVVCFACSVCLFMFTDQQYIQRLFSFFMKKVVKS